MPIHAKPNTIFFPQTISSYFISANRQIIHPGSISQSSLSFFAYCLLPLYTGSQVLKFPIYSFYSSPIATILVRTSTNSCSDYWNRLTSYFPHQIYPKWCHLDTFKTTNKQIIYKSITSSSDFSSSSTHISAYLTYLYLASFASQI